MKDDIPCICMSAGGMMSLCKASGMVGVRLAAVASTVAVGVAAPEVLIMAMLIPSMTEK